MRKILVNTHLITTTVPTDSLALIPSDIIKRMAIPNPRRYAWDTTGYVQITVRPQDFPLVQQATEVLLTLSEVNA